MYLNRSCGPSFVNAAYLTSAYLALPVCSDTARALGSFHALGFAFPVCARTSVVNTSLTPASRFSSRQLTLSQVAAGSVLKRALTVGATRRSVASKSSESIDTFSAFSLTSAEHVSNSLSAYFRTASIGGQGAAQRIGIERAFGASYISADVSIPAPCSHLLPHRNALWTGGSARDQARDRNRLQLS